MQRTVWALALARASAGRSMPAKMAMMAMTTSNSINVKACRNSAASDDGEGLMDLCHVSPPGWVCQNVSSVLAGLIEQTQTRSQSRMKWQV